MEGFWVLTTIVSFVLWMSQLGKIRTLRDALAQAEGKRASEKENCDVQITRAKADCAESIAKTKADCETQIAKVKADCADSVSRTKVDCADSIAKIKADCEKQIALEKERSQNEAYDIIGTIADGKKELASLLQTILVESINLASYEEFSSEEIKNKAQMIELQASEMIKNDKAVSGAGLAGDTNRQANNRKRQILRCFSAEFDLIAEKTTIKSIDAQRAKLAKAYETINRMFELESVRISEDFFSLKLEELSLVYLCLLKREAERETQRAIREQMLEEEKVLREIEREKQRIEKEEAQFRNEVTKLMGYMSKARDEVQSQLYVDKIRELEEKLASLAKDKENALEREQNTRAGFVYIISNIGSFGEDVYKIGMTRRLEPMDRIKELGDASVPFAFDVHAMIFSSDAPALETLLHKHFKQHQLNRVNNRKEFFKVGLPEIKDLIQKNHNATVEFVDIPEAFEYRESLRFLAPDLQSELFVTV